MSFHGPALRNRINTDKPDYAIRTIRILFRDKIVDTIKLIATRKFLPDVILKPGFPIVQAHLATFGVQKKKHLVIK